MDTFMPPINETKSSAGVVSIIVIIMIVVGLWWYLLKQNRPQEAQSVVELNSSLDAIMATTTVTVPTTVNPLKSATPAVNPIEKTNPFNNEYQNPFQ